MSRIPTVTAEFRHVALPDELRTHRLVARSWCYTLPVALLDGLQQRLRWEAEQLSLERALAEISEAIPACVGFGDGTPISDGMLRHAPALRTVYPAVAAYLQDCQQAGHCDENFLELAADRRQALSLPRQGYLGWLWTNRTFREEFQQLTDRHSLLLADGRRPPQPVSSPIPGARRVSAAAERDATTGLREFCQRWRLQGVTGPATVEPLAVHVPAPLPSLQALQAQTSGTVIYFPDIAPLPDRDELRKLVEDNARSSARGAEHLHEWIDLVRSDTQGKKPIGKFARWYPLQHYHRVLWSRHCSSLHRCRQKLILAFAEYLQVSDDTVERDLSEISDRLGALWP